MHFPRHCRRQTARTPLCCHAVSSSPGHPQSPEMTCRLKCQSTLHGTVQLQEPCWVQCSTPSFENWVPVTTARGVLRLLMEGGPADAEADANILNDRSPTADKGWSSSLGVRRDADNFHRQNLRRYKHVTRPEVCAHRFAAGAVCLKYRN